MTTISTVGYGDIVPPPRFRPYFAVFFLLSVVLFAYILGESLALVADIGKYRQLHRFFREGLTQEMLDIMDCYEGDGRVCFARCACCACWRNTTRLPVHSVISDTS